METITACSDGNPPSLNGGEPEEAREDEQRRLRSLIAEYRSAASGRHEVVELILRDRAGDSFVPQHDGGLPSKNARSAPASWSFEACSAFTHVTACLLAESPEATRCVEGSDDFVTSIAAPTATGWNDSYRA